MKEEWRKQYRATKGLKKKTEQIQCIDNWIKKNNANKSSNCKTTTLPPFFHFFTKHGNKIEKLLESLRYVYRTKKLQEQIDNKNNRYLQ